MRRYHLQRALRAASLSAFEEASVLAALLLVPAAVVAAVAGEDAGGIARALGCAGLAAIVACAASRGVRLYRAGARASLPPSVGRVSVRARPPRVLTATTIALALGLPLAVAVTLLAVVDWAWLPVAAVLLLGCAGAFVTWAREAHWADEADVRPSTAAAELLARLCMRADMPVPLLAVAPGAMATAWTAGGRIHVTQGLLRLLDDAELEAVLAHELAHLAHRDAAIMEICSAPSRVLLACAGTLAGWSARLLRFEPALLVFIDVIVVTTAALAVLLWPPAFVIGWIARLSVLGISRARELSADAAAATLTGRPSALASALLKLDGRREWTPRADLRQAEAYAVLCIVGTGRSRLLSTHPSTAARVKRLEALETRIQSRWAA
jgi:heat shock protein HtpX